MKSSCHKRIVIWCITEYHKFCAAKTIILFCKLCCFFYFFTKKPDSIHIKSCLCGTYIYGRTYKFRRSKSMRNRFDQQLFCPSHSLGNKCGITAQKIYAYCFCGSVKRFCNFYKIIGCPACRSTDKCNWSNRNSFIYNRNTDFLTDFISRFYKFLCLFCNLFINFFVQSVQITVNTV